MENESEETTSFRKYIEDLQVQETVKQKQVNTACTRFESFLQLLEENLLGCDLIICFFMAALNSYHSHRCLRPFPHRYVQDNMKDFTSLRNTCEKIPYLPSILKNPHVCPDDVKELLSWLFLDQKWPKLHIKKLADITFPNSINESFKPHYVLEIVHSEKSQEVWERRINDHEVILAYHGSAIHNFYSILSFGLQQHFSVDKEVLFGNGVYLSTEIGISAHYSPFGKTWNRSLMGGKHSVIAICEIINDARKVKCKDSKRRPKDCFGDIPEKYFVVTDNDMVRIKYLLVYTENGFNTFKSFLSQNVLWIILLLYFVMLVVVGFFNGGSWRRYIIAIKKLIN